MPPQPAAASPVTVRVAIAPLDLRLSLLFQNVGTYDPTCLVNESYLRKSFHAQTGPCTVELRRCEGGLTATVLGADAAVVAAELARGLAQDDGYARFSALAPPLLQTLHRRSPGLRILRFPWLYDHLCAAVLQQRVRWQDAARQFRVLALATRLHDEMREPSCLAAQSGRPFLTAKPARRDKTACRRRVNLDQGMSLVNGLP